MKNPYLHEHSDFKELLKIVGRSEGIDPFLVEKDYWIMHCLYGLKSIGLNFELKGGTSLSKGFRMINRFSEDIDIQIYPDKKTLGFEVYTGKNHNKDKHIRSRRDYFQWISERLDKAIPGIISVEDDPEFGDSQGKYRNAGIRVNYESHFTSLEGVKEGVLLEIGFDQTTPIRPRTISSWAYDKAQENSSVGVLDNRAVEVPCYEPKYTFVEKLQTIVRKYRQFKEGTDFALPANFIRHYYDLFKLLENKEVLDFIGTEGYFEHKRKRFVGADAHETIADCEGFRLPDPEEKKLFEREYEKTSSLYYREKPQFQDILDRISKYLQKL
jgi:hypothetical protein